MAVNCKTSYDTCKTGVTPGDYFHRVELPYIYRRDSELDAQVDLQKHPNVSDHHEKKSTDFFTMAGNCWKHGHLF